MALVKAEAQLESATRGTVTAAIDDASSEEMASMWARDRLGLYKRQGSR